MSTVPAKFSVWMREERTKKGWSVYELSKSTAVHRTTLSTIENDGRDVRLSTFVQICAALGAKPSAVMKQLTEGKA